MINNARQTSCGHCNGDKFRVYSTGDDVEFKFHIECIKCGSTTVVSPQPTRLKVSWGKDSKGILCYKD